MYTPVMHMGNGGINPPILTLGTSGRKWSVSFPERFILGENAASNC